MYKSLNIRCLRQRFRVDSRDGARGKENCRRERRDTRREPFD